MPSESLFYWISFKASQKFPSVALEIPLIMPDSLAHFTINFVHGLCTETYFQAVAPCKIIVGSKGVEKWESRVNIIGG